MNTATHSTFVPKLMLLSAMAIWGSLGLVRHYIPLDSALLVVFRSILGAVSLGVLLLVLRRSPDWEGLKRNWTLLIPSGIVVSLNWVLLFEAFKHTTVAVAIVCYYMAPILVMLFSPFLLKESINVRKGIGIVAAFLGIAFVSGLFQSGTADGVTTEGVLYGLGAAAFYASIVFFNKRMTPMDATTKTGAQLVVASLVLIPYSFMQPWPEASVFTPLVISLIVVLGVVHTGFACALYFGCMDKLPAQTVALYSYLDPILAVLLSALVLQEPMSVGTIIGTVLVLGGALIGESRPRRPSRAQATSE